MRDAIVADQLTEISFYDSEVEVILAVGMPLPRRGKVPGAPVLDGQKIRKGPASLPSLLIVEL